MDCKARLPCTVRGLFDIYGIQGAATSEKFFEIFSVRSRKTSDERRSNLVVVRSEDAKSDTVIDKNKRNGGIAQLARAPALQAGGQRFESVILHTVGHSPRRVI